MLNLIIENRPHRAAMHPGKSLSVILPMRSVLLRGWSFQKMNWHLFRPDTLVQPWKLRIMSEHVLVSEIQVSLIRQLFG